MRNRVCVVTGASRGIGRETALALAEMGADVALVCRDRARGESVLAEVRARAKGGTIALYLADLSLTTQVRRVAAELRAAYDRIGVLVNNAGALLMKRELTAEGLEKTFATNHVAYFLLTDLLLDRLAAGAPARVVSVASAIHHRGAIALGDLGLARGFTGSKAYAQSKLANVMWTYALARRLTAKGVNVTATTLHPGVVASSFLRNNGRLYALAMTIASPFMTSERDGAKTSIYLASSPEVEGITGKYFEKCKPTKSSRASRDEAMQERLWEATEAIVRELSPEARAS